MTDYERTLKMLISAYKSKEEAEKEICWEFNDVDKTYTIYFIRGHGIIDGTYIMCLDFDEKGNYIEYCD